MDWRLVLRGSLSVSMTPMALVLREYPVVERIVLALKECPAVEQAVLASALLPLGFVEIEEVILLSVKVVGVVVVASIVALSVALRGRFRTHGSYGQWKMSPHCPLFRESRGFGHFELGS